MCITIQFSHRNQPFLLFRLIIFYHILLYMSIFLSNVCSFFCQHRYVHYRIMPVIAYQESKAGNSSHHLKRMGEFLQCYVKKRKSSKEDSLHAHFRHSHCQKHSDRICPDRDDDGPVACLRDDPVYHLPRSKTLTP